MADGGSQGGFNFPAPRTTRLLVGEIIVDLFAGGGGASEGLYQALGQQPALAYNHDRLAIGMHAANHPLTQHFREDIWKSNPVVDVAGRRIGWFHASSDCTHFSQAKGGQPRSASIRSLSWVVLKWVGALAKNGNAPRIISLENVWQILKWGPLVAKRDKATGRVIKLVKYATLKVDKAGNPVMRTREVVSDVGEQVSVWEQSLVPDKRYVGRTWQQFVAALEALGYVVEWRKLIASDYGAGTSRERLFMIARNDGMPIVWPVPTHGSKPTQEPVVSAATSIDFADRGRSIFDRKRPLAEGTLKRVAKGIVRHILEAEEPFFLTEFANASSGRTWSGFEPLRTQCAGVKGGHFAMVEPELVRVGGLDPERHAAAVETGDVVAAFMATLRNNMVGSDLRKPLRTIAASGEHHALVTCNLSPEHEVKADRVAAFLVNYYGNGTALDLRDPLDTVTTKDRMALVTVTIRGTSYVIVDIRLRMLRPRELFNAQGFGPNYIIERTADGEKISNTAAVRMVGNSVSPKPICALAYVNTEPMALEMAA